MSAVTDEQVLGAIRLEADAEGWVSSGPLVSHLRISRRAVLARLAKLQALGRLERHGRGAKSRYRDRYADSDGRLPATFVSLLRPPPDADLSRLRPAGLGLRAKLETILLRGEPRSASQLARDLVVPVAEVTAELNALVHLGELHRGPKIVRHPGGDYAIGKAYR